MLGQQEEPYLYRDGVSLFMGNLKRNIENITKTCPCNIKRYFLETKIENFIGKF